MAEMWSARELPVEAWPPVERRREVRSALAGSPDAYTRVREREPAVFLFVTDPIRHQGRVTGAVYVTRSTRPVLVELYKIRSGLIRVLIVAVGFTLLLTLMLAWSISRPLSRLARRRATRAASAPRCPSEAAARSASSARPSPP
ncbi:MAG: cell wall metabolism sensor histidine kinase WalK [Sandaracinaceae bacterium]|nr:cell wall metabolism sensor histidine kinase WalK [Sandaracinaceae bacterium]